MEKVVLGLSGGVDSAVAAALLIKRGFEVHGAFLDIGVTPPEDAALVAKTLGIDFNIIDIRAELEEKVCKPFTDAYLRGRTPNPCVICNPTVKFPSLLREADRLGAEYVATGHYARVTRDEAGRWQLRAAPCDKDQSYMLARLGQDVLSRAIFPLGEYTKDEVRAEAANFGLPVAAKSDSMEICFIPDNDHGKFIRSRCADTPPGDFISPDGKVLGQHRGIQYYTIGQRRGLGVSLGHRMFVSAISPEDNTVTLSDLDELFTDKTSVNELNWVSIPPQTDSFRAEVKVRHSRVAYCAEIIPQEGKAEIMFDEKLRRPAKGQLAVFYRGDLLLGCGTII